MGKHLLLVVAFRAGVKCGLGIVATSKSHGLSGHRAEFHADVPSPNSPLAAGYSDQEING
jgi:hypothetical protein